MILSEKLINELVNLEENIQILTNNKNISQIQLEGFLRNLEKRRYNILNEIKIQNKAVEFNTEKIKTINDEYKAVFKKDVLNIYIPETMPSYKNLKTQVYKNILLNISEVTKDFKGIFKEQVFIYIKIYDNIKNWDVDNKFIKPISDALILSGVIQDDNIDKMFYSVKGEYSEIPHTEVYIITANKIVDFLQKCIS